MTKFAERKRRRLCAERIDQAVATDLQKGKQQHQLGTARMSWPQLSFDTGQLSGRCSVNAKVGLAWQWQDDTLTCGELGERLPRAFFSHHITSFTSGSFAATSLPHTIPYYSRRAWCLPWNSPRTREHTVKQVGHMYNVCN